MVKLLTTGAFLGMLSNVTGIPLSPYYPTVKGQEIRFEATKINTSRFEGFKAYVASKF